MSIYDDETELGIFDEPETVESPRRPRRRLGSRPGGPRRPAPPPGTVAVARLVGLVVLAVALVVGLAVSVGGGGKGGYAAYMDGVQPIAQRSARVGSAFAGALGSASLTLSGLRTKLEGWAQEEQQAYDQAQALQPPGPLQSAQQELLAALQLRALGLANLAGTLAQAGSKPTATVASELATQAQLLSASDIVWAELFRLPATETLARRGVTGVIAPASRFVANPDVISSRSFALVYARLKSTAAGGKVTGLHGSALVGTAAVFGGRTVPLSTSTPTTVDVAPDLVFRVTFTDSGNYQEVRVPVTLQVTVSGQTVLSQRRVVPSILAKRQATVSFGNLQLPPAAFGASANVHVEIGKVPGEVRLANNGATYPVFFSLPKNG
ncbi:MAG TPA: hypothetical protein VE995_04770 [Gaiellaceae bacterium]|nr:hypothetical protein [Gaiellaceae bacterium]